MTRTITSFLSALALVSLLPAQDDLYRLEVQEGQRQLLRGNLSKAENSFDEVLLADEESEGDDRPVPALVAAAHSGMAEIDWRRGRYQQVLDKLGARPAQEQELRTNRLLAARSLERLGRYEEALEILAALATDPLDWRARSEQGRLLLYTGQGDVGRAVITDLIADGRRESPRDMAELGYLGRAHALLGGADNVLRASQLLADSVRNAPDQPEARTAYGWLVFQVYGEAAGLESGEKHLKKVLDNNGDVEEALLALYRLRRSNFQLAAGRTESYLNRILALNPRSVPALVERGALILDDRRFEDAGAVLDQALSINPRDKWALAHRAAAAWLRGDGERDRELRQRALQVDPGFAGLDRVLADHLVALYRFGDAVPFYEEALLGEPDAVQTLHGIAKALIYTGNGAAAVEYLQRAKELQPGFVHPWRNNALAVEMLLAEEYVEIGRGPFKVVLHKDDAAVLEEYLLPLHLEAAATLGGKYQFHPAGDVRVEVFHTWDDFSVRTIGFRGFTALGACFGPLITLVSPVDGDLRKQDFMWTATVWHEYTHVLTLGLSKHRVPRWLTEGFSVYEEGARNPAWERGMDRELFDAFHNHDIPPVRLLNRLFRTSRILFGYYQGGLIVEFLAEEHGFSKVIEFLRAFGDDLSTQEAFKKVFGESTAAFDKRFLRWIEKKKLRGMKLVPHIGEHRLNELLAAVAVAPDDLNSRVRIGWAFLQRRNPVDAGQQLGQVLRADPQHGSALLLHAALRHSRGDGDGAMTAYAAGFANGAEDFDSRIAYGRLLMKAGKLEDAVDQFQRAKACWPRCTDQHASPMLLLAAVYRELGRMEEAIMETKAFCQRTARAFAPRLALAAWERQHGNHKSAARYLAECVEIDPFMRQVHLDLGDSYERIGAKEKALLEYRMALAVPPPLDRQYRGSEQGPPDPGSDGERTLAADTWVRIARLYRGLGQKEKALQALTDAETFVGTEGAAEAARLRDAWN